MWWKGVFVVRHVGELDAVVGQHGMDGIRHGGDEIAQELSGDHLACLAVQLDEGGLAGPVDRHEQPQLALAVCTSAMSAGPVGKSLTAVRFFHLATVF
jgi:hypothetical protein